MNQPAVQQIAQNGPSAIPTEIRRVEGREWWLWGFAIVITLALTLGIISFTFPWFNRQADVAYWFGLREWVRGLAALVLLFDVYAIYQHLQLQRIRHQLAEQHALRHAEEKYRAIFEDAVIGIFQSTPDGRPLSINRALAHMHGYDSPEQLLAEVSNVARQLFVDPGRMGELTRALDENDVVRATEVEVYRRDRTKKWLLMNLRAVRDAGGKVALHEGTVEDITDRKVAEERVQYLAYYDALTGLPNRTLLHDRLSKALAGARRQKDKVALLFLDLDRFKNINDSLGHSVGDLLLKEAAERLKNTARGQDTVARLAGDEFLIVLTDVRDIPDAAVAAERFMDAITAEFIIQGHPLSVSCSLGISIFPEHGADGETLIKHADAAMYCAKDYGRASFRFFTEDMNAQAVERLTLENSLRLALDRQELFLVYQPQMDMGTGKVTGLEALLRWQHPELGLVPPDKFIRIAENSGLIMPIGEWVLRTACSQARKWQDAGLAPVPVAVNVSAVQFRQEGFRELIRKVLQETGLAAEYLELELTESLLLSNADVRFLVLQDLKAMGLKLAIDDFGTGYSSFSYLKHFPVSKLKIDRSFVSDVAVNPDDAAITTAIISMAKSLNLKVIAEGVENEGQMSFLRAHHCDEIQGYYFSKPLSPDEVFDKLRSAVGQGQDPDRNAFVQSTGN
jgi:diguanylate cyclase (GGDEF)-like protein/PAS domain S-box-containing protein